MAKQKKITKLTEKNLEMKIIQKLELTPGKSYMLLFEKGTIPFEQAQSLAAMMANAGFKALFAAVNEIGGIKVIEQDDTKPAASKKKAVN